MGINRKAKRTLTKSKLRIFNTSIGDETRNTQKKILKEYKIRHPGSNNVSPVLIHNTIAAPISAIANLSVNPGDRHFMLWYSISVYFPLLAATLGPLANMISLVALLDHWRLDNNTGLIVTDTTKVKVLNSISLGLGLFGNLSFTLNFSRILLYTLTQITSICCWFLASALQLTAIVIVAKEFKSKDSIYLPSDGFWFGVFTSFFYFSCACLLSINFIGYKLKKYPDYFNLTPAERRLMIYTVVFAVWALIGCGAMHKLISGLTYGSALYFCVVSFLTIGLGDILPITTAARVLALFLSLNGVIVMGLIVSKIREVVDSSTGPTIFWHEIESKRMSLIERLESKNVQLTPNESFNEMRRIKDEAKRKQLNISLIFTISIFLLFWLIGGLVFHFVEHWNYFDSIYFCFLCLITIGYGDFAPVTPLGRVFFISWAISAVPLMTMLISNIDDKLYYSGNLIKVFIKKISFFDYFSTFILNAIRKNTNIKVREKPSTQPPEHYRFSDTELSISSSDNEHMSDTNLSHHILEWTAMRSNQEQDKLIELLEEFKLFKKILLDMIENPEKIYDSNAWSSLVNSLDPGLYWLEKNSPMTLPLREPLYFVSRKLQQIEKHIKEIIILGQSNLDDMMTEDDKKHL